MKLRQGDPEEAGMSVERVRYCIDLARGWVDHGITPALVVLAARRGVTVIHEAFGRLTPEENSPPLELDSIFHLASLTKPITATLAMILVEDGLLGLNRPVSWYIPEFAGEGKDAVMVHHLLTHTSGLRDEDVNAHAEKKKGTVEIPPSDETQHPLINERLFLRYDAPLWKPAGEEMHYCSYGYRLLGEIIRRVSGESLQDFAQERVFEPLGMKDTFYIVPEPVMHRIVKRPEDAFNASWLNSRELQEIPSASGGAYSTAMDMAIFGQMFLNNGVYGDNRVLSPATVAAMTRNQIPGIGAEWWGQSFPEASWSLGWSVCDTKKSVGYAETLPSQKAFSHGGSGGVFLWMDPVYEIVGSYLSIKLSEDRFNMDLFMNAVTTAVMD